VSRNSLRSRGGRLPGLVLLICLLPVFGFGAVRDESVPRYRIVLDPGHGGKPEACSSHGGAHWDRYTKRFLNHFRYGVDRYWRGRRYSEHQLVLTLARKVRKRLVLTESAERWPEFEKLIAAGTGKIGPFRRVALECLLSRDSNHRTHPKAKSKNVNRFFRLFDSPEKFPYEEGDPITAGRLSKIARLAPSLVVCLHVNGCSNKKARGLNALFVPHYDYFELGRRYMLEGTGRKAIEQSPVTKHWWYHNRARTKFQWMLNDAWTYFTGYGCTKSGKLVYPATDIGVRANDLQWAYQASVPPQTRTTTLNQNFDGVFWDRERSDFEKMRRSGGIEGFGGDSLYAGQELVRYIRYGLWKDFLQTKRAFGVKWAGKRRLDPMRYLGPHGRPTAADWAVPLFSNAVVAFLEVGYLTNDRDFWILRSKLDQIADALAVGIYSLHAGLEPVKLEAFTKSPRGRPINWEGYMPDPGNSYFEAGKAVDIGSKGGSAPSRDIISWYDKVRRRRK